MTAEEHWRDAACDPVPKTRVFKTGKVGVADLRRLRPVNLSHFVGITGQDGNVAELLGYARVSTTDQSVEGQLDALRVAGVDRIWTDVASGVRVDRPGLAELVATAAEGDTVVVVRLDRLGRSLPELLALVADLAGRGVGLRSLGEQIDTTNAAGRLVLHVFGALAEFERALMHERLASGLAVARLRGRVGGRPRALSGPRLTHARQLFEQGMPVREIAQLLGVGRSTVYRVLQTCRGQPTALSGGDHGGDERP